MEKKWCTLFNLNNTRDFSDPICERERFEILQVSVRSVLLLPL